VSSGPSPDAAAAMGPISRAMKSGRLEEAFSLLVDLVGRHDVAAVVLDELLTTVVPSPYPRRD
jgi:hypothetical protein